MRARRAIGERAVSAERWSDVPLATSPEIRAAAARLVDVVFAIGCWEGQSKRYRVGNVAQGLRELGHDVLVLDDADLRLLVDHGIRCRRLVVFRAPMADRAHVQREVFRHVRRNRGEVVADFDDLVFEPEIVPAIAGFRTLSASQQAEYMAGVHGYRQMIEEVDLVTCTTEFLAERVRELGTPAAVVRNSLDRAQLETADELTKRSPQENSVVRIAYLSGTKTHQDDFGEAAPAIERLLDER